MKLSCISLALSLILVSFSCDRSTHMSWYTEGRMKFNHLLLEKHQRLTGQFPLPGYVGPADRLKQELAVHGDQFVDQDGWGKNLLYVAAPDGSSYVLLSYGGEGEVTYQGDLVNSKWRGNESKEENVACGPEGLLAFYTGWKRLVFDRSITDEELDRKIDYWIEMLEEERRLRPTR